MQERCFHVDSRARVRWRQFRRSRRVEARRSVLVLKPLGELFRKATGSGVAPGRIDDSGQHFLAGGLKVNAGRTSTSPSALDRYKYCWIGLGEIMLLLRCELDHSPPFRGISEGGKDLSAHTKIGMVHVRAFCCLRQSKSQAAEIIGSHGKSPRFGTCVPYIAHPPAKAAKLRLPRW